MKTLMTTVVLLAGILVALLFAGCADYGNHEKAPEPLPPVEICDVYEDECSSECPEPEICEECQPPEDPCECIKFNTEHTYQNTEDEERCLTKFAVRHGVCVGDFDFKVYCENPNYPGHWVSRKTWVRGCGEQDHWSQH